MSTGVTIHKVNRVNISQQTLTFSSTDEKFKVMTISAFSDAAGDFEISLYINDDAVINIKPE